MQTLRTPSVFDLLEERSPSLDLLIVDEAHHHRNRSTAQHRAVRQLSLMSDAILFLNSGMHFISMHLHIWRRLNSQPHLPALDTENDDADIRTDRDAFASAPG